MFTALPISFESAWEVLFRKPHSIAKSQHPADRYLIKQLSEQTQPAMEVSRGDANNELENLHNVNVSIYLFSVLF